jgi:CheY-like chemotaxis protein
MIKILWVDDEIDLLKPHIIYLTSKGYNVISANSGDKALDILEESNFDLIFLDENMPGLSGLETLSIIKAKYDSIPVIMITKSEEESIMEEAIGSKIADYLIKPVNPSQILLSIKKNIDSSRLVDEKTTRSYQQEFRNISISLSNCQNINDWYEVYKKLIFWELELSKSTDSSIDEIINIQKSEANNQFFRFIKNNYKNWINNIDAPLLSNNIFKEKVFPHLNNDKSTFMILIDNLRYDQWKVIQPLVQKYFTVIDDSLYSSILPTATQYSRNSIFAGLHPSEIQKKIF